MMKTKLTLLLVMTFTATFIEALCIINAPSEFSGQNNKVATNRGQIMATTSMTLDTHTVSDMTIYKETFSYSNYEPTQQHTISLV